MSRHHKLMHIRRPLFLAIALACGAGEASAAATVTVNSSDDSAASSSCNLRSAIQAINASQVTTNCPSATGTFGGGDSIVFAPALIGSTITLAQGQLVVSKATAIIGNGQTILADPAGARVIQASAPLSIYNLTLSGGNTTGPGGAIYARASGIDVNTNTIKLTNSTISGNHADGRGGGIYVKNNLYLKLALSTITANTSSTQGAGLNIYHTPTRVFYSTIADNIATCTANIGDVPHTFCSGGAYIVASRVDFDHATISGNSAQNSGTGIGVGGMYAWISSTRFVNSTIAGNSATGGNGVVGGVWESHLDIAAYHDLAFTNTTISGNSAVATSMYAKDAAGGVLIGQRYPAMGIMGSVTAANSIISGNSAIVPGRSAPIASPTPDIELNPTNAVTADISFSLLGTAASAAFAGNGNVFSNAPRLGPLQNNGGPTKTRALRGGSVAINAGSNALAVDSFGQPLGSDQTGNARVFNGNVDIGAVEYTGDGIFDDGFEP